MSAYLISSADLVTIALRQFPMGNFQGPCVMNARYVVADRQWVEKMFTGYMWNFEKARGQLEWRKRGNQCEHFALRAALEAVDLLRLMPAASVPVEVESLAVAACKYQRGAGTAQAEWHEVNLWFHSGAWYPWEPQTRRYFEFTDAEIKTVHQLIIP